jgi:hypothetical protein
LKEPYAGERCEYSGVKALTPALSRPRWRFAGELRVWARAGGGERARGWDVRGVAFGVGCQRLRLGRGLGEVGAWRIGVREKIGSEG